VPRLLIVSPYSIDPPIHGGAVRMTNLVKQLAQTFEIHLLIFVGGTDDPEQRRALLPWCRRVFFQQREQALSVSSRPDLPPEAAEFASPRVAERLEALVQAHGIDVVLLDYTELGQYAKACGGAKVVLVEIDIWFRSAARRDGLGFFQRYGGAGGQPLARLRKRYELEACRAVDQIHVMSAVDGEFLARHLEESAHKIRIIPNGVDLEQFCPGPGPGDRRDLLFLGSFPHLPNLDALDAFLAEVWPRIRACRPATRLTVAGAQPPRRVLDLDGQDGIRVAGEVSNVVPLYQNHRALVVPVRAGSGTRLKILEAFACGLPVVSTTLGAEGIEALDGKQLLLADGPEEQARACLRVLENENLAALLAAGGRRLVEERFSWTAIGAEACSALLELVPVSVRVSTETEGSRASIHPLEDSEEVEISVIVATDGEGLQAAVAAVRGQHLESKVEILWPSAAIAGLEERTVVEQFKVRKVEIPIGCSWFSGRALNRAADQARGRILVFLGAAALPADETWLHQLTAPFFYPAAPAAVAGSVVEKFASGVQISCMDFTAEARQWRETYSGVSFSLANCAIRRDVWETFPLGSGEFLEDLRWQRQITAAQQLILPCLGALVLRYHGAGVLQPLRRFWAEGSAWRGLGVRYRTFDALRDLLKPQAFGRGWLSALRLLLRRRWMAAGLPWLRVLGVFGGNRLQPRARTRSAQGFTTPASGPGL
jgi:glycosyltransferase involved in cell wall biosynthesis